MAIILLTQGENNVFVDTVKVNGVQNNIGHIWTHWTLLLSGQNKTKNW